MPTTISIVRHGETAHNAAKIIQGHLDTPLNSEGEAQARVVARYLSSTIAFDEAWSSDLSRAKVTAETIVDAQDGRSVLQVDERIRERFLGDLQGKHIGEGDVSTIEPTEHLRARLFSFWDTLLPPSGPVHQITPSKESSDRQILLVSHGGAIRGLVAALLEARSGDYALDLQGDGKTIGEGTSKRIGNCSITQFVVDWNSEQGRWVGRLVRYADQDHFVDSSRVPSPTENVDVVE